MLRQFGRVGQSGVLPCQKHAAEKIKGGIAL